MARIWTGLSDFRKGWLVGILEGEGCITKSGIEVEMTDRDVMELVSDIFSRKCRLRERVYLETGYKPSYRTSISGSEAATLLSDLYPHLSARRQQRVRQTVLDKLSLLDSPPLTDMLG